MKTIYINLDSRTDRRAEAEAEFKRVGLTVERFPACVGDNRPLAFNKSVRGCMELARKEKRSGDSFDLSVYTSYEDLLLFEDDVMFDDVSVYELIHWQTWPENYMTIHLGANIIGMSTTIWKMPEKFGFYNDNLVRLHNAWQTHAILYSAECVKFILDNFPYYTHEYEKEGLMIFDEWLRVNVFPLGRSYVMKPMIAYQRESFSDIWNCPANYEGAHKQGNEWMKNNL